MPRFLAFVLHLLATALTRLPWRWLLLAADAFASRALRSRTREARVVRRNLELAYPDLLPTERDGWLHAILQGTARQALETLRLWTRPHARNLSMIREQHGAALFEAALKSGRGVIVAAPHYGNWELLNQWLAARTPLAILYAPPESEITEAFLNRVRSAQGDADRITQVRAEGPAVRQLFKVLKDGGVVGILPDQQPKQGDGEFAPFFGQPALTMTLLGRLAARTGATVLMAWCERVDAREAGPRYALHFEPAPAAVSDADPVQSVAALNAAVERIARRDPAQYQWTYKRYSLQPGHKPNPYWPDCY